MSQVLDRIQQEQRDIVNEYQLTHRWSDTMRDLLSQHRKAIDKMVKEAILGEGG